MLYDESAEPISSSFLIKAVRIGTLLGLLSSSSLQAQNDSSGSGVWSGGVFTSGTPDRQDGVPATYVTNTANYDGAGNTSVGQGYNTLGDGQTVQVVGGHTITVDNTVTGIATSINANGQSTGVGGTGYAETSATLNIGVNGSGTGSMIMSGGRLDVGMVNGGPILQGSGDASAGTVNAITGALSTDANFRDVSYYNSVNNNNDADSNDPNRQLYLPTDVYDPLSADAANAGTTTDPFPLHYAGGFLHVGYTTDGTFTVNAGELNVVQYGWGWASDSGSNVSWDSNGGPNRTSTDTPVTDATFNSTTNSFEGYGLDYGTGGYVTGGAADRTVDTNNATNYMFVDAESLEDGYANGAGGAGAVTITAGAGEGDYQFSDPTFATDSWDYWTNGSEGPYADDGSLIDHYHQIARTGGDIRVGHSEGATGQMNINGGQITTNNMIVGHLGSGDNSNQTTGIVNMDGGDLFTRESIIIGHTSNGDIQANGALGTFNYDGGKFEAVNDVIVGNGGTGTLNITDSDSSYATRDADGNLDGGTAQSHVIIGDDLIVGSNGRYADGTVNFTGITNILSGEREGNGRNQIILGNRGAGANNHAIGRFNYEAGAGEIGDSTTGNRWDSISVGNNAGSAGDFRHNNENVIDLDWFVNVGNSFNSMGHMKIEGDKGDTNGDGVTGGGLDIDQHMEVGAQGFGIVDQGGDTVVSLGNHTNGGLFIGRWSDAIRNDTRVGNNNDPYLDPDNSGQPDPSIEIYDDATTSFSQDHIDSGHGTGHYNVYDNAELNAEYIYVAQGGNAQLNYDSTKDFNVDRFVEVGREFTADGQVNLTSNNIAVNFDTDATGTNNLTVGRSGLGQFNVGTTTADANGCHNSDGNGEGVTLNAGANNDIVVGTADTIRTDFGQYATEVTDAGDGTFNLNGDGSTITLNATSLNIGTGDNVSEGLKYQESGNTGTIDINGAGVALNVRDVFRGAQTNDSAMVGGTQVDVTKTTGTQFGTGSRTQVETLLDGGGNPVLMQMSDGSRVSDVQWVASDDDGKGSIGRFNHNNDWAPTFDATNKLILAEGDNSIGVYNQNGASTVTMGASGGISMSRDSFDTGNASASAATAISAPMSFEMGQSTYSVNNASAVLDLNKFDVTGDSVDVTGGDGNAIHNTFATQLVQGGLQNRDNEAQINLYDGKIINSRGINADVVQFGGEFNMSASNDTGGGVTTVLSNGHDFIQKDAGTTFIAPACEGSGHASTPTIAATTVYTMHSAQVMFDGTAVNNDGSSTFAFDVTTLPTEGGGSDIDTLIADFIYLNHSANSIVINNDEASTLDFAAGQYWDLLDFENFLAGGTEDSSNERFDAFDLSALPTLGLGDTGTPLMWSIDPNFSGPDIWETHGIIYIAEQGYTIPEPCSFFLSFLGFGSLLIRRKR